MTAILQLAGSDSFVQAATTLLKELSDGNNQKRFLKV